MSGAQTAALAGAETASLYATPGKDSGRGWDGAVLGSPPAPGPQTGCVCMVGC